MFMQCIQYPHIQHIYMHVHGFQQKTNHFQSTIFTVHWNFPIVLFIVGRHLSSHQHPVITKYSSFQVNFVKNLPKLYKIALRYSLSPSKSYILIKYGAKQCSILFLEIPKIVTNHVTRDYN